MQACYKGSHHDAGSTRNQNWYSLCHSHLYNSSACCNCQDAPAAGLQQPIIWHADRFKFAAGCSAGPLLTTGSKFTGGLCSSAAAALHAWGVCGLPRPASTITDFQQVVACLTFAWHSAERGNRVDMNTVHGTAHSVVLCSISALVRCIWWKHCFVPIVCFEYKPLAYPLLLSPLLRSHLTVACQPCKVSANSSHGS